MIAELGCRRTLGPLLSTFHVIFQQSQLNNKQVGLYNLFQNKLQGPILMCVTPTNPQKFCLLLGGVYSNAENQNISYPINIKCEEKIPNKKQRIMLNISFYKQTGYVCFFYINAAQQSPVQSQGNDFVISVKYIGNEISGNTKCAQT